MTYKDDFLVIRIKIFFGDKLMKIANKIPFSSITKYVLGGLISLTLLPLYFVSFEAVGQNLIEEIIVTARKREENLQDVPISISAFSASRIEDLGLKSLDDISLFTPGFSMTSFLGRQPGSDRPEMRGITTILNGVGNASSVAYFIDGVYLAGSPQSTELHNLERVEILRGPQAAAFGRGTYMGAINFVTKKPSEKFEGALSVSTGDDGYFEGIGWVSGPISDTASGYLSVGFDSFDGQYTNTRDGSDLGGEESTNITAKLFWNPSDDLDVSFKIGYQETDDGHPATYLTHRTENNCCFRDATHPRAREYYQGVPQWDVSGINLATDLLDTVGGGSGLRLERTLFALTVTKQFSENTTFTSLTGYTDDEVDNVLDVSYSGYDAYASFAQYCTLPFMANGVATAPWFSFAPGLCYGVYPLSGAFFRINEGNVQDNFSQEFRVTTTLGNGADAIFGVYYYEGEAVEGTNLSVKEICPDTGMWSLSCSTPLEPSAPFNNPFVTGFITEKVENIAFFAGIDWDVNEQWSLGLEVRYAEDEITVNDTQYNASSTPVGCDIRLMVCNDTFESVTPRFTALYKRNDNTNFYFNIAQGTKPGDFNSTVPEKSAGIPDESYRAVDEEIAWSYEAGVKSVLRDGRANINASVFFLDVTDQQLTQNLELASGLMESFIANIGETEVKGIEVEGNFQVTDTFTAGLTYSYTDAEITKRISQDHADLMGSDGSYAQYLNFGNTAGKTMPRVPKNKYSLFGRYQTEIADGTFYAIGTWAYESSKYAQEHNLIETGSRSIVGVKAGFNTDNWEYVIWIKNLFDNSRPIDILRYIDKRYGNLSPPAAGVSSSPRGFMLTLPRKRQIGATINYRF